MIIAEAKYKKRDRKEYSKEYHRTRAGVVTRIYSDQRKSSKKRNHPMPSYSKEELKAWMFSQPNFEALYKNWVESGFETMQKPSCDRTNDYKPYSFDNLKLTTWAKNKYRSFSDRKAGVNNKTSKAVLQLTRNGTVISDHYSATNASRVTGVHQGNITDCCGGKRRSAGGFIWRFANA